MMGDMPENWWTYVTRNAPGRSRTDIGSLAGVDPSQASRWKSGGTPRPETAIRFARSIGGDPIGALSPPGSSSRTKPTGRPSSAQAAVI